MKEKCIFIIGPESSGSTLIAKIISTALNGTDDWNGRGFNCCNSASCDRENGFMSPCGEVKHLVCHRSLPFFLEPEWPPIEDWKAKYDASFIICTRDATIAERSVAERFKRNAKTISEQQNRANQIISELLKSESKSFIWSYETFMYLQEDYLQLLFDFLKLESDYELKSLRDANFKYIKTGIVSEGANGQKDGISSVIKKAIKRISN